MQKQRKAKTDPRPRDIIIHADGKPVWCRRAYKLGTDWVFEMRHPPEARVWTIRAKGSRVRSRHSKEYIHHRAVYIGSEKDAPVLFEGFTLDESFTA